MRIELPNGTPAELARPALGDPVQGLVLCPDIMGLRPLFDTMAERLAEENGGGGAGGGGGRGGGGGPPRPRPPAVSPCHSTSAWARSAGSTTWPRWPPS